MIFALVTGVLMPLQNIFQLENGFLVGHEDIEIANKNDTFGSFISTHLNQKDQGVSDQKNRQGELVFKLFGFIPIRKVEVSIAADEEYYVGGVPIGISISSNGAIVVSDEFGDSNLKEGDIITHINGEDVGSLNEIQEKLQNTDGEVEVEYLRKNKLFKTLLQTRKTEDGSSKLGLWVKDDVSGIGTLTFVNKETHKYGALGHPIVETNSGNVVPVSGGKVFKCNLIGINKGKKNDPGQLKCVFLSNSNSKGSIDRNSKFGINGTISDIEGLVDENKTAQIGGRLAVKMGKAKIVSSISGIQEEYEIEIIKTNYQKSADDKSIVFRVKDKRLLELTGGIVQGMSGSPILQEGKIVGAVTHVFLNDPAKGYGVYSDWMLTA